MNRKESIATIGMQLLEKRKSLTADMGDPAQRLAGIRGGGDVFRATTINEEAAILEQQGYQLRNIDDAISRFRNGTYGICEGCGSDIPLARLRADPTAANCVGCQSAVETQANGRRGVHEQRWERITEKSDFPEEVDLQSVEHAL